MATFKIVSNREVATNTYELWLEGDASGMRTPGQFVTLTIPGFFLSRPLSVAEWTDTSMRIFYKAVGDGTKKLASMKEGGLDVTTGLGNGYIHPHPEGKTPVLIAGGSGVPPMLGLTKKFVAEGLTPVVILGFNREDELFLTEDFKEAGADLRIATADGSVGAKGFVTTPLEEVIAEKGADALYVYACGPLPMFRSVVSIMDREQIDGSFSMEERMGCGMGICYGCSIKTKQGMRRVCKEGPVFKKEAILW
ncbi:MAG: dihydroorotate dehydrogenase electron transfer subunit [Peptoniphilaceae bacterium]|nr:dihydroorotate dehydrogenase electron transfer subunit [Peptoniphilaceae bacterium]MDY6085794.1 dihydroorotate dehydrogenase electron transfer subunit [Peptoniphilaceae bacterium]